ncbi:hypothetical protein GCM10023320_11750 [Pseudonocardia adelaidensis]|uniref:DDE family transposase n=1 Tax=Pseudonocardia adelaidensis TaxID=648754 RepID=A0ABP9NCD2_9PSEU
MLADKTYYSRANRAYLRSRQIPATIPVKADQVANRIKRGSRGGRPPTAQAGGQLRRAASATRRRSSPDAPPAACTAMPR